MCAKWSFEAAVSVSMLCCGWKRKCLWVFVFANCNKMNSFLKWIPNCCFFLYAREIVSARVNFVFTSNLQCTKSDKWKLNTTCICFALFSACLFCTTIFIALVHVSEKSSAKTHARENHRFINISGRHGPKIKRE